MTTYNQQLYYVILLFALFIIPRLFQRFRLPGAITSLALGALAGMGLELFVGDAIVTMLATFGIVSLFLFAGLDIDLHEVAKHGRVVTQHLFAMIIQLVVMAAIIHYLFHIELRPAMLVGLALTTPSTGFILDSLKQLRLSDHERFWIRSKAVASEIVALLVLFVVLQSTTLVQFGKSVGILAALIFFLPLAFRLFANWILPYAPRTEFAFMLVLAVTAAFVTLRLGVYYLVGAFLVGLIAHRFRDELPALSSDRTIHAVEVFATLFIPFYFFAAGLHLRPEHFSASGLLLGAAFLVLIVPARLVSVALHRWLVLREPFLSSLRIGTSIMPTLVFTLVIAEILRDRFEAPAWLFGGLIVYTLGNTLIPGFALGIPTTAVAPDAGEPENPPAPE